MIILEPTKETRALCDDTRRLIRAYLNAKFPQPIGRFEAELEAYTILKLMIRHAEAVVELASNDLVLLPAATVLARAGFEASIRVRWMLRPVDPYEREVRWLLHFRTAIAHCAKLAQNSHLPAESKKGYAARRDKYNEFGKDIERLLLERGYSTPAKAPNVWEMLKDLNDPQHYVFYILLSAYTHSTFEAGNLYRQNLGCGKKLGEFISPASWLRPFEVTWKSFFLTARDFLYWIGADASAFESAAWPSTFEAHLNELRNA
ncbi:MAG: hypothetical protein HY674_07585 [Chloroflexi bacterium]|nr:hypothetical protein [Chloroflexota bacterium]